MSVLKGPSKTFEVMNPSMTSEVILYVICKKEIGQNSGITGS